MYAAADSAACQRPTLRRPQHSKTHPTTNGRAHDERPSKSARKRAAHAAQDLGEELIRMRDAELDALDLPETLVDAIRDARRITQPRRRRAPAAVHRQADARHRPRADPRRARARSEQSTRARPSASSASRPGASGCSPKAPPALEELERWRPGLDRDEWSRRIAAPQRERTRLRTRGRPAAPQPRAVSRAARVVRYNAADGRPQCQTHLTSRRQLTIADETARRHHHGLVFRLGDDAAGRRDAGQARHPVRSARGVRSSHARPAVRVRLHAPARAAWKSSSPAPAAPPICPA